MSKSDTECILGITPEAQHRDASRERTGKYRPLYGRTSRSDRHA
ncbi:hypothetical protein [Paenibacillus alvei]|nr:hypothetical protein [Paenibacillus alvei]MEC0083314.1 hypothetical protein [Paenibacillus alvei]